MGFFLDYVTSIVSRIYTELPKQCIEAEVRKIDFLAFRAI